MLQFLQKRIDEEIKLDQDEISKGADVVNQVVQALLEKLKSDWFFRTLSAEKQPEKINTGSNYEGLKVARPDEYDVMLAFDIMDPKAVAPYHWPSAGAGPDSRYFILEDYLTATGDLPALSPATFKQQFHRVVYDLAQSLKFKIEVHPPSSGPNILIKIHRSGRIYDMDLVPALKGIKLSVLSGRNLSTILSWMSPAEREKAGNEWCFLVAKEWKGGCIPGSTAWRLSFSLIEKMILNPLPPKMKSALRLLKSDLGKWKEDGENSGVPLSVSSYHLKTLLLNYLNVLERQYWNEKEIDEMYKTLRSRFTDALSRKSLPHYFLPGINLIENLQLSEQQYLLERLGATNTTPAASRTRLPQQKLRFSPY